MKQGIAATQKETRERYSRKAHRERDRQASLLAKPKEITPLSKMPIYNPMKDRSWQAVMPRIREVERVS